GQCRRSRRHRPRGLALSRTTVLWHNPRCGTSRNTLALLQARGLQPEIRLYLQLPPTRDELVALRLPAGQLLRWKDAPELPRTLADAAILDLLAARPALIERPVLLHAGRAAIGRPPEAVLHLLD